MKVCTITCHDVYNHGASLQAYGLMKYLENAGHEAEIIDYKPDYLSRYRLFSVDHPSWDKNMITRSVYRTVKLPLRLAGLRRKRAFDAFTAKHLKRTPIRYTSNAELKMHPPEADAYLCGSDQIWNTLHRNGKDPAFYLDFVPKRKIKASYAASLATESIAEELQPFVKKQVSRLDGVGVRESSGVKLLHRLNIKKAVQVVDPVFLLDRKDWDRVGDRKLPGKYILVYDFDNSRLVQSIAQDIARKTGYRIYAVNESKLKYAHRYFIYDGPETFVSLVRDAQFVVSNSFHAAVFSIVYEKNFVIVNRTESINSRMRDLLEDLQLLSRLAGEDYRLDQLLENIPYAEVNKLLLPKIHFSKNYLNDVLLCSEKRSVL